MEGLQRIQYRRTGCKLQNGSSRSWESFSIHYLHLGTKRKHNLLSARHSRLNGDTISGLEVFDFAAHLDHRSGALVSQHNGAVQDEVADAAALPVVDVAAAYAGLLNVNADIVLIPQLGDVAVLKGDLFDLLQHESGILRVLLASLLQYLAIDSQFQSL